MASKTKPNGTPTTTRSTLSGMDNNKTIPETIPKTLPSDKTIQSETPRVILMGATGSGKSTFISTLIGTDIGIGHELESCTKRIYEFPIQYRGREIVLVDTPGFDDTDIPDVVVLKRIGEWMKRKYIRNEALIGVIYLHKVSDNRFTGSSRRNLRTFQAICGPGYSPRVCLGTTLWAREGTERYKNDIKRHEHIKTKWWKDLIKNGARAFEIKDKSEKYPIQLLDHILGVPKKETERVCLQLEIAKEKKKIDQTAAGQVLDNEIMERINRLEAEKGRIEGALRLEPGDEGFKEELDDIKSEIRLLKGQKVRLRGSLGGMILYSIWPF